MVHELGNIKIADRIAQLMTIIMKHSVEIKYTQWLFVD